KLLANGGDASLARFEQEVQLLAALNHPNIVTVHDYGRTADGSFYYAMELLDGMDLAKLVAAAAPQRPRGGAGRGRGARRGVGVSRHQAAERIRVPVVGRARRGESPRLRAGQEQRG